MFSVQIYIPGLTKKEPGSAGCTNATCNGLLKWADGTHYAHVPGMPLTFDIAPCAVIKDSRVQSMQCFTPGLRALCMIP